MAQLTIDSALLKMNANREIAKEKGTAGEEAVLALLQSLMELKGGFMYHSYTYPYSQNRQGVFYPGNILLENDKYVEYGGRVGISDEIDVLYVTPFKVFAIEVKARAGTWKIFDHWATQNSRKVDKHPIAQAEKHARHLYHQIYEYLPDGAKEYIVPMVVFVDKAKIEDSRSAQSKNWIPIAILNNLRNKIMAYDVPLKYSIDLEPLRERLKNVGYGKLYK